uniref:Uncharacterized protein n=1 Tax=Tanacetum cinerariifolium TaxID=118510 RepID=A0A6L2KUG3_TANCI|nr:hypothetical protein [Tanacetum cinerariifolium]
MEVVETEMNHYPRDLEAVAGRKRLGKGLIIVAIKPVPVSEAENPSITIRTRFNIDQLIRHIHQLDIMYRPFYSEQRIDLYSLNNVSVLPNNKAYSVKSVLHMEAEEGDDPDDITKVFKIEGNLFDYETPFSDIDGFYNGGELPGMVQVKSMTYFQDQKWYDELVDGKLKEETLTHKAKVEDHGEMQLPRNYRADNIGHTQDNQKEHHQPAMLEDLR